MARRTQSHVERLLTAVTLGALVILLLVVLIGWLAYDQPASQTLRAQVEAGAGLYAIHCASCHGTSLEGQPDWRRRGADGRLPAPPHDRSGHTWHHSDEVLLSVVKSGTVPPLYPEDYRSNMPGFGHVLTDAEIASIMAFIKSRWPRAEREFQARRTREGSPKERKP